MVRRRNTPVRVKSTEKLGVDNRTRAALHAPTSKNWALQINYPFGSSFESAPGSNEYGDPSESNVCQKE